jgi:hypothetical protein
VSVRPEFGPTLPALLQARGVSRRTMVLAAVVLAAVAAGVVLLARAASDTEHVVVAGPPEFNIVFTSSQLQRVAPHPGELLRLEGHRRHVSAAITVRAVHVTPPAGTTDIVDAYLPIVAEQRQQELRARYGTIQIYDEGKARISDVPGYQIGFSAHGVYGRDVYVLRPVAGARDGVLLSLRRFVRGPTTAADGDFFKAAKLALTSFAFGTDQP